MKLGLMIAAMTVGAFALWMGMSGNVAAVGIAAFSALALLFFANMDRIETFKASAQGIEATTRAAEAVVKRAEATLTELQDLATVVAKIQMSLLARNGRAAGYSDAEQETLRNETVALLERIGVTAGKQAEVLAEAHRLIALDYANCILPPMAPLLPQDRYPDFNGLRGKIESGEPPTPDELMAFFRSLNRDTDLIHDWIEDYRHFLREKTHRRPDVWVKRDPSKLMYWDRNLNR
jgi:hypothetical protein